MFDFGFLEYISTFGMVMIALQVAIVPAFVYVVGRWREDKTGVPDPNLGFVTLFGLLSFICFTLAVVGLQMVVTALLRGGSGGRMFEPALALLVAGTLTFVPCFLALRSRLPSRAARLYLGLVVLGSALVSIAGVVMLTMHLFLGGRASFETEIGLLVVHLPIAIVGAFSLARAPHPRASEAPRA